VEYFIRLRKSIIFTTKFISLRHTKIILTLFIFLCHLVFGNINNSQSNKFQDYKLISEIISNGIDLAFDDKIEEGLLAFDKALALAKLKNYEELIPIIVLSKSRLFAIEDRNEEGLQALLSIKKYFETDPQRPYAGDYFEYVGHTYLKMDQMERAIYFLKKSEQYRLIHEPGKNWRTYNGLAEIYDRLGQDQVSREYLEKSKKLSKIQNTKKMLGEIKNDLAFNEREGTIAILSSENIATKSALNRSRKQNTFYLIVTILSSIIAGLLYFLLIQRNRLNKEIVSKNEVISKNLEEKEYLVKEIHHRVKNNLQVISSLLSLQSRTLEDQYAKDALQESQSRVLSISLIHQNLYKQDETSMLDLKVYLSNLSQQLFNTYNLDHDRIKLKLEIDEVQIDVTHLVPLGLIVNELITNSIKYAFTDRPHGTIKVSCKLIDNLLRLNVEDDGIGNTPILHTDGFGNRMIDVLAKRIDAKIIKNNNNGTSVDIIMPYYNKS